MPLCVICHLSCQTEVPEGPAEHDLHVGPQPDPRRTRLLLHRRRAVPVLLQRSGGLRGGGAGLVHLSVPQVQWREGRGGDWAAARGHQLWRGWDCLVPGWALCPSPGGQLGPVEAGQLPVSLCEAQHGGEDQHQGLPGPARPRGWPPLPRYWPVRLSLWRRGSLWCQVTPSHHPASPHFTSSGPVAPAGRPGWTSPPGSASSSAWRWRRASGGMWWAPRLSTAPADLVRPAPSTATSLAGRAGTDPRKHSSLTGPGATTMTISGISSVGTTSVSPGTQHSSSDTMLTTLLFIYQFIYVI